MMTRKERRAAEHAARKAERKASAPPQTAPVAAAETTAPQTEPVFAPTHPISAAQLEANRRNAHLSHGPTTEVGRKKVSMNALKTGLTGVQVLLPTDDAALYEALIRNYQKEFEPVGPEETYLLQSIIDTRWRLARIPALEFALVDLARRQLIKHDPALAHNPAPVFEMQARSHLERDLRNLHLQENRLVRRREREMKELRELQATRKAAQQSNEQQSQAQQAPVTEHATAAATSSPTPAPAENGTVFPPPLLEEFLAILTPETRAEFLNHLLSSSSQEEQAAA